MTTTKCNHCQIKFMPSSRIQWIDFCRVWTAFFVVLRHVDRPYGSFNYIIDLFNYRSLIFFSLAATLLQSWRRPARSTA